MQMQKKTAKECEDQVLIIIILSFCNQPTESLLNNFLCSFSDTMCGVDAWRKGENQKIVGFSLYEVLLLPICEICLFCPHFLPVEKAKGDGEERRRSDLEQTGNFNIPAYYDVR